MQIYKFNSILKPVLWGGDKLLAFKGLPASDEPIGESWELSAMPWRESVVTDGADHGLTLTQLVERYGTDLVGEDVYRRYGDQFPLLIKFIDARRDLSIQVHPDDDMACRLHGCMGKNEMWYILEADEGAVIRTGFTRQLSPDELDRRLADGTLLDVIHATESKPGDTFFIPAGQIHAIGAGNLLVEIQQSSDVTYRVWDYNRRGADGHLRELHVDQAREALNYNVIDSLVAEKPLIMPGMTRLFRCPMFDVCRVDVDGTFELPLPGSHSFVAMVGIKGEADLQADGMPQVTLGRGETALVPAITSRVQINGQAQILLASIPTID
ncbi:MAG: class I mannose-6-phosphate isomerase [Muribaculaceae bacterium]|nr:class I mannose-6-phosphate isomerase [Muribaculaceae bacterium]